MRDNGSTPQSTGRCRRPCKGRVPTHMPLPTFFIIGAPKCGTTSLHSYLDQHPEIGMSLMKETHFFIGPENIRNTVKRVDDLDEYEKLFEPAFAVRGEASPSYTAYPMHKGASERIKETVPEAKFIYLVRDPIDRTMSHYMHRVALAGERRPPQEALGEALDKLPDANLPYICPSLYASQLDHYLRLFPQERILVVDQADLFANRREALREMFAFLSVDETFDSPQLDTELGASSERRVYRPGYVPFAERIAASPLRLLPRNFRRSIRRSVERILWPPLETPALDDDLRGRLEDLYANEVERLRALTGKGFTTWGI
jgi:hypothetical protein